MRARFGCLETHTAADSPRMQKLCTFTPVQWRQILMVSRMTPWPSEHLRLVDHKRVASTSLRVRFKLSNKTGTDFDTTARKIGSARSIKGAGSFPTSLTRRSSLIWGGAQGVATMTHADASRNQRFVSLPNRSCAWTELGSAPLPARLTY